MKKLLLITVLLNLLNCSEIWSQSCLPEGITFTNQNQIDSFQQYYPDCTEIEGNVHIQDFGGIYNLNGLSILTSIGGYFEFYNNHSLTNLEGLNNLQFIGGYFEIHENDNLVNLSGLDSLSFIGDYFQINDNGNLTNLTGLDNLDSIGGDFKVIFNFGLINLNGVENLTSISGDLLISGNGLHNLEGLDNLSSIGNGLFISGNSDNLISLNGIGSLASIGGELSIEYNYVLNSISSLENITPSSIEGLTIEKNYALSTCQIQSICEYLANPSGSIEIQNNSTGCNNREEVEEACLVTIPVKMDCAGLNVYPNPFNTSSTIEYTVTSPQSITISFYDTYARKVDEITEHQQQGLQKVVWTPDGLNEGVYYFTICTSLTATGKDDAVKQLATGKVVHW